MRLVTSIRAMQALALRQRRAGRRIGLVPTMGFLHEGHLSLVRAARQRADWVVVSLFVNPTQFGPGEDYARYPRNLRRDAGLLRREGVDVLFHPTAAGMYEAGHSTVVDERRLSMGLCGASRPGHFTGVLTVVAKLFNIVLPDVAVFGQKDAQQARLIRQMARDLNFPLRVAVAPIVREPDGLAMSSRNQYLSVEERERAQCLSRSLRLARSLWREGMRESAALRAAIRRELKSGGAAIDYVAIVDADSLQPVDGPVAGRTLVAVAARVGKTRLIDNVTLPRPV